MKLSLPKTLIRIAAVSALLTSSAVATLLESFDNGLEGWSFVKESTSLEEGGGYENGNGVRLQLTERAHLQRKLEPAALVGYRGVAVWIYSEQAGPGVLGFFITSERAGPDGWRYFHSPIRVDWQGWKRFEFTRDELKSSRQPDWEQVVDFGFSVMNWPGWCVPDPEASIVISKIELIPE